MTDGPKKFHLFLDQSVVDTNAPEIFKPEPEQTVEILVHGRTCPLYEPVPFTTMGWLALQLVARQTEAGYTEWVCPRCEEVVVWRSKHGELEFGI